MIGKPFDHWAELEKTYQFVHACKPELFEKPLDEAQTEIEAIKASTTHGGSRPGAGRPREEGEVLSLVEAAESQTHGDEVEREEPTQGNQGVTNTLNTADQKPKGSRGATNRETIIARIKRDAENPEAPNHAKAQEALRGLEAKTITSAQEAGRVAGIRPSKEEQTMIDVIFQVRAYILVGIPTKMECGHYNRHAD